MDSMAFVFELQNDCSVKLHEVPPKFPRSSKSRLHIITNQNTQLHLLNKPAINLPLEKPMFQHGVSTKVFAVTDPTGTAWEVRLLLSPSEISRLSSNYNLMGFVIECLTKEKYRAILSSLCCQQTTQEAEVWELCKAAAQFLSYSEDQIVNEYCKELSRILMEKVGVFCTGQQKMQDMVVGALVALVAAELASSIKGTESFDYKIENEKTREDQSEKIQEMMKVFDVMAELLTVSHQGKRVHIICRNPCPDNWASGGKKNVESGETFVFGLCHKVVSISAAESEIQFLQSLQESYDLFPFFHLPGFVEHLLMISEWRKKVELFLTERDQRKEIIHDLSSLAKRFVCCKTCHLETFSKEFQSKMLEKWSSVEVFLVGEDLVCAFSVLVAILGAITAKFTVDKGSTDGEDDPEKHEAELVDTSGSAALETNVSPGLSSSLIEDDLSSSVTDEYGGSQTDLGRSPDEMVKSGNAGGESRICSTNDPETTNQRTLDASPKMAAPLGVGTTDQQACHDGAKYPGVRDLTCETSLASEEQCLSTGLSSTPIDEDLSSFEEIGTEVTHEESEPKVGSSPDELVKSGDVIAESGISSTNDPDTTDQGSIYGSTEICGVGTRDAPDQETGDDDAEYPGAKDLTCGISSTSAEADGALHSRGGNGGPALDDPNDDEAYRSTPPPSVEAQDHDLERGFLGTYFIVLCLLVFAAMVCLMLPQSVSSVLVAITFTLGLLILKWLVSWQK